MVGAVRLKHMDKKVGVVISESDMARGSKNGNTG